MSNRPFVAIYTDGIMDAPKCASIFVGPCRISFWFFPLFAEGGGMRKVLPDIETPPFAKGRGRGGNIEPRFFGAGTLWFPETGRVTSVGSRFAAVLPDIETPPFVKGRGRGGNIKTRFFGGEMSRSPETGRVTSGGSIFAAVHPKNPSFRGACSPGSGGRARGCTAAGSRRRRTAE